jgi:hypothetical protein
MDATRARAAWQVYLSANRGAQPEDLMTDLAHLADADGWDGAEVLEKAERHYHAEVEEDRGGLR